MPGHKVSADEWNALFNLSRVQGNNNADGIALLMEMVGDSAELPSILDDYDRRINSAEELVNDLAEQVASFDTKLSEEYIIGLVSKTYVTKTELETANHKIETFTEKVNEVERKVSDEAIINTVSSEFYKKTEVDDKVLEQRESFSSELKQEADSIKASVKGLTNRIEEAELALTEDSLVAKLSSTYATKSTVEGIDQRVTTLTEDLSNVQLELTTESILAKVSDVVATKQEVNALQDQYDTLDKSVTEYKAEIDVQKDSIASVVKRTEKIEQEYVKQEDLGEYSDGKSAYEIWLEAGNTGTVDDFLESLSGANGRNLLLRTRDFGGGWSLYPVTRVGYGYEDGFTYVDFPAEAEDGTNRWVYNYKSALKKEDIWGKEFVLSYELRADEVWAATGDNLAIEFALANESTMSTRIRYRVIYISPQITTEWVRFEYKGTFNESLFSGGTGSFDDCTHFWIRFYNTTNKPLQVRKFKLELGNQATEWTEAPEDTALAYSGGRNLILDSDVVRSSASYCVNTSAIETSGGHYVPSEPLIAGEEYTITACITPAEGVKCYNVNASHGNANECYLYVNGTERQITSATFKARYAEGYTPDDAIINANLLFYRLPNDGTVTGISTIHWIKVEKGNKASDWTPAPEDVNTQISQELIEASSRILQTSEEITLGILAGYTKASDLEAYKKQVENLLKVNEEGVSMEFEQMASKLNELGGEITTQKQYIRFIEGSIYIGHSDSPYSSVYTNDTLEFRYNDQMVARFTNEVLEVRNISAENQVTWFDQWAIRKGAYVNGVGYNLNDIWIGG